MPFESASGLRSADIPIVAGVDEISSSVSDELMRQPGSAAQVKNLQMVNWRIAKDGKRIEKRDGLTASTLTGFSGTYPIYGYTSYLNTAGTFCQIIVTSKAIWRRVGSADWASIYTWTSDLTHPMDIHEINGMQFFITEFENVKLTAAGTVVRVSIVPPATLPTITTTITAASPPLDDKFAYANNTALDAVWADQDASSVSGVATTGPTTQGPDAHALYLRLYDTSVGSGRYAQRSKTISGLQPKFNIEMNAWFHTLGAIPYKGHLLLEVYNGTIKFAVMFAHASDGGYMAYSDLNYTDPQVALYAGIQLDTWQKFKFIVDSSTPTASTFQVFIDGVDMGTFTFNGTNALTPGLVKIKAYEEDSVEAICDAYIDNLSITVPEAAAAATPILTPGRRRYAVTYVNSGDTNGNYGTESGPIKGVIGAITFSTAPGKNDMTVTGIYESDETRTIRVQVDSVGTIDTVKWSLDDGKTWSSLLNRMTPILYLPYRIILHFASLTGHTDTNYWKFTCTVASAVSAAEKVSLTAIPTSSDPQVNQRKIYRTVAGGSVYYLLATIYDKLTTTYDDNVPDGCLGLQLNDWAEVAPVGKYSCYWDDRLWILSDTDNIAYYSDINDVEVFQPSENFIPIKDGMQGDVGMGLKPYREDLYIFKRRSTYRISPRLDGTYSRYCISRDFGMASPAVVEALGLLMFVSFRGIEAFNGEYPAAPIFSMDIDETFKTIDTTYLHLISIVHSRKTTEVFFSFPDRTGGASAITGIYNYVYGAFYFYQWHKTPSKIVEARNSSGGLDVILCSRDGLLFTANSGAQDGTTNIDSSCRPRWFRVPLCESFRHAEIEFEAPTGQTLTVAAYVNLEKTAVASRSLAGSTPAGTDLTLRKPVLEELEFFVKGTYVGFKFTNATAVGSDMKISSVKVWYNPIFRKGKIAGD